MTISKHIPKRRFKEFVSEDGWVSSKFLDNISQIIDFRGRTPKKLGMDWSKEGYLALSALNVKNGYIDKTIESHFGDEELYNKWMSGKELQKNQVIFTTEAPMGNVAQIPDENKYILSQRTIAFKVNDSKIIDDFLAVLLRSKSTFDSLLSLTSGGTAKGVSQKSLEELSVFIPNNLKEQTFISIFLKKIDTLITLQQHKLDKLKNLKKSYLAELFPAEGKRVPKRRFPGFEGEWEEKKLEELGKVITGNTPSTSNTCYWSTSSKGHTWVTPTDINDILICYSERYLSDLGWLTARTVPENSVLITSIASIGKNTINTIPVAFNQQINAIVPQNHNSYFILSAMSRYEKQFKNLAGQTATPIINKLTFEKFEIPVPSIEEQEIIGEFFKKIDKSINLQQQKLDKLKDLKKAYLNELFV